ncbi:MAG: carbohydrate ABC transporter permease [Proteobacteria bacterium]|nr:carbohydrate ABC transporter permease [Pseudomonadota bacterium]
MRKSNLKLHLVMVPWALLWLAPLWLMAVYATLPDTAIFSSTARLLPGGDLMANLRALQADTDFARAFFNSVAVSVIYTALALLVTSMAGYAFACYRFRGNGLLFAGVLATLTVPWFVLAIPQYILVARDLHLTNTWAAIIVPALASSLGVFFMRQTFLSLHPALLDAARVDGAGETRIFFRVALPLVRPSLAALGLILFLASWNDYLWPLLVLNEKEMYTAPVALGTLIGLTRVSWGAIMAGALVMTTPLLVLFMLLQRHFLAGISAGAVKD